MLKAEMEDLVGSKVDVGKNVSGSSSSLLVHVPPLTLSASYQSTGKEGSRLFMSSNNQELKGVPWADAKRGPALGCWEQPLEVRSESRVREGKAVVWTPGLASWGYQSHLLGHDELHITGGCPTIFMTSPSHQRSMSWRAKAGPGAQMEEMRASWKSSDELQATRTPS